MSLWKIAGIQMDSQLGDRSANIKRIVSRLEEAADLGAQLVVFPECALTGYGAPSRAAAMELAEMIPGPATDSVAAVARRHNLWVVFGLLEKDHDRVFNACAIVGPDGSVARYRKIHLPCIGLDRFMDPGDEPFRVHDLGGLRIGVSICFDGSFPETARIMTLMGADLLLLPTNWADNAKRMAAIVPRARAFENHVYHMAVNRVGVEAGLHYIGESSIHDYLGDELARADHDREVILTAEIDPEAARQKRVVHCAGEYEIDRVNWRRPEFYGPLLDPMPTLFRGHHLR